MDGRRKMYKKRIAVLMVSVIFFCMSTAYCKDISLDDAIQMALANNTGLYGTLENEDVAKAELSRARGENGLTLTLSDSFEINKNESTKPVESTSNRLSGNIPLFTGGKNQASIESGELGVKSAHLRTERECEDLKFQVIQAYYNAVQMKRTIAVRQEAVDNYTAHYDNVSQLYAAGDKARVDVLRASVELSNAQYDLTQAKNDYEVRIATLRNYLNIDRDTSLTLTEDFGYSPFNNSLSECINYAYIHRKDLLIDLYTLRQKELAIKIAQSEYLPNVSFSIGTGLGGSNSPNWSLEHDFSTGISATWNIFDTGVTRAQINSAKSDRNVAQITYNKDREQVDLTVRESYYNMRGAESQLKSTQDAVKQAEEDYFIAKEKYRAGEGIMLDVLDAQKSLSDAQLNHIMTQFDYLRYKASVENAMGIGLTRNERIAATSLSNKRLNSMNLQNAINTMEQAIVSFDHNSVRMTQHDPESDKPIKAEIKPVSPLHDKEHKDNLDDDAGTITIVTSSGSSSYKIKTHRSR